MAKPTAPLLLALVCAACLAGGAAARSLKGLNDDVRWVAPAAGGDCTAACRNNGGIIDGGTSGHALCAYKGEAGEKALADLRAQFIRGSARGPAAAT